MRKFFCSFSILILFVASLPQWALFAGTETVEARGGVPRFTLDQAILTALQRNPQIQIAKQEIERTKGLYLELRADILPRVDVQSNITNTDPQLGIVGSGSGGGLSGVPTQYSIDIVA